MFGENRNIFHKILLKNYSMLYWFIINNYFLFYDFLIQNYFQRLFQYKLINHLFYLYRNLNQVLKTVCYKEVLVQLLINYIYLLLILVKQLFHLKKCIIMLYSIYIYFEIFLDYLN